jgi:hypothetical protein
MSCCGDDMVEVTDCSGARIVVCVWCERVEPARIRPIPPYLVRGGSDVWKRSSRTYNTGPR